MFKFEFFEEATETFFGHRFGRAIQYKLKEIYPEILEVSFSPGIVLSEDELNTKNVSKETLICYCILALAKKHKTVYVNFNVYKVTLKVTNKDNLEVIRSKLQKIQNDFIRNSDIY